MTGRASEPATKRLATRMRASKASPSSPLISSTLTSTVPRTATLAWILLVVVLLQIANTVDALGSFQSGPIVGSLYAGGLDYTEEHIFVTGITYDQDEGNPTKESSCFVSIFGAETIAEHPRSIASRVGDGNIMESCHAIHLLKDPDLPFIGEFRPFVVAGTSDPGGIYGSAEQIPSGFLMALDPAEANGFEIVAGLSLDDAGQITKVSYPVAIIYESVSDGLPEDEELELQAGLEVGNRKDGTVYIASVSSSDLTVNTNNPQTMEDSYNQPNWLKRRKYGNNSFEMTLQRIDTMPEADGILQTRLEPAWTTSFNIEEIGSETQPPIVDVGGMILAADQSQLIVAGSTNGSGIAFGQAAGGRTDMDGFIAVVDTSSGKLAENDENTISSLRIGTAQDDSILGICADPSDPDSFYVVGTTGPHVGFFDPALASMGDRIDFPETIVMTSENSHFGFVQKRNSRTLELVWGKLWGANHMPMEDGTPADTSGIACTALEDGTLYVAGVVKGGAHVKQGFGRRHKGDEILAARFDASDGTVRWITQFGSADGSEDLAPSGALAVDINENLVIYGETTGSLFRKRDDDIVTDTAGITSDVFLATVTKEEGAHDQVLGNHYGDPWGEGDGFGNELGLEDLPEGFEGSDNFEPDDFEGPDGDFEGPGNPDTPSEQSDTPVLDKILDDQLLDFSGPGKFNGGKWNEDEIYKDNKEWFQKKALGIQSGPNPGAVYAGGMVYSAEENAVFLTGIVYAGKESQASCMLTKLPLSGTVADFSGAKAEIIGSADVLEVCNTVALHKFSEVVVVGSADKGSALTGSKTAGSYPMAGFAMAFDRVRLGEVDSTPLVTDSPATKIEYPIDVVSDGDDLYVVSLTSTDPDYSREFQQMRLSGDEKYAPNWINMQKYGASLDMTVTKLSLSQEIVDGVPVGGIGFMKQWSKEFPVDPDGDGSGTIARVYLGGTIVKKNLGIIVIAGSTRGMGMGYGAAVGNDEDGFIVLLEMETGELSNDVVRNQMREGTAKFDIVLGICDDPNDDEFLYIVGATKGELKGQLVERQDDETIPDGSLQAFVRKVEANNIAQASWTVQLGAVHKNSEEDDDDVFTTPTTAKAFDCVVSGDNVYVAGVVDDNARIVSDVPLITRGGDDIWVGQVNAQTGELGWLRQAGSAGNDHIAPHGGLALGANGSVLVFGDTDGAFYRDRADDHTVSEMFVMEFDARGGHKTHVAHHKHQSSNNMIVPPPVPAPSAPPTEDIPSSMNIVNADEFGSAGTTATKTKKKEGISTGTLIGILMAVALVLMVSTYFLLSKLGLCRRSKIISDKNNNPKIKVRDGLITNDTNSSMYSDFNAPPPSSFLGGKASMFFSPTTESVNSYSDNNLKNTEFKNVV